MANQDEDPSNPDNSGKRPTSFHRPDLLKVLNKNPKYRYRWVNLEKLRQNGGMHYNGWRLLTNLSKAEESIVKEHGLEGISWVDGIVRRYEMALAFMTLSEWKQLKGAKEEDRVGQLRKIRKKDKDLDYHEFKRERGFD